TASSTTCLRAPRRSDGENVRCTTRYRETAAAKDPLRARGIRLPPRFMPSSPAKISSTLSLKYSLCIPHPTLDPVPATMSRQARKEAAAAAQDLLKVDPAEAHKVAAAQSRKDAAAPMLKAQEEWSRVRDMLLVLHQNPSTVIKFVILET
ncbi:unnamed protein product, partial [Urochloa humidicola]